MAQPPVGVDEQSTRHTSTPKGRFVLRADSIRPYSGVRKSAGCLQKSEEPLFLNIYKELEILPVFYDSMIR